jgi:hypothetical protein
MKFQARTQTLGFWSVGFSCFFGFVWLYRKGHPLGRYDFLNAVVAALWLAAGLWQTIAHNFVSWELDAKGIRQTWFKKKTEIDWKDVTHVGLVNSKRPKSSHFEIDYVCPGALVEGSTMLVDPVDREGFIGELRRLAPAHALDV